MESQRLFYDNSSIYNFLAKFHALLKVNSSIYRHSKIILADTKRDKFGISFETLP